MTLSPSIHQFRSLDGFCIPGVLIVPPCLYLNSPLSMQDYLFLPQVDRLASQLCVLPFKVIDLVLLLHE
jgi:hypothetical protein